LGREKHVPLIHHRRRDFLDGGARGEHGRRSHLFSMHFEPEVDPQSERYGRALFVEET
jgi:hypothetical protein